MAEKEQVTMGRKTISPAIRKQLQSTFTRASQAAASGNMEYAAELYRSCVMRDPANKLYAQAYVETLQKKFNNNPKSVSSLGKWLSTDKAQIATAAKRQKWSEVFKMGVPMIAKDPWDSSVLMYVAEACFEEECEDSELVYYDQSVKRDSKDVEVNRRYAKALVRHADAGEWKYFDKALVCLKRILDAKPTDEEARKLVAEISVKKTITKGGYEEAVDEQDSTKVKKTGSMSGAEKALAGMGVDSGSARRLTPAQQLEKDLEKDPTNINKYLELAEMHLSASKHADAIAVLDKANQASGGGDQNIRERLENVQMDAHRQQIAQAKGVRDQNPQSAEAKEAYLKIKREAMLFKLEVFRNRCDRDPANLGYWYEYATCLEAVGKYKDAIGAYQKTKTDASRQGKVLLRLGICFTQIKQYQLAMTHFKQAVDALPDADEEKIIALYSGGVVSMDALKDVESAKNFLNQVASIDFGYKDVSDRLDKLNDLGDN